MIFRLYYMIMGIFVCYLLYRVYISNRKASRKIVLYLGGIYLLIFIGVSIVNGKIGGGDFTSIGEAVLIMSVGWILMSDYFEQRLQNKNI